MKTWFGNFGGDVGYTPPNPNNNPLGIGTNPRFPVANMPHQPGPPPPPLLTNFDWRTFAPFLKIQPGPNGGGLVGLNVPAATDRNSLSLIPTAAQANTYNYYDSSLSGLTILSLGVDAAKIFRRIYFSFFALNFQKSEANIQIAFLNSGNVSALWDFWLLQGVPIGAFYSSATPHPKFTVFSVPAENAVGTIVSGQGCEARLANDAGMVENALDWDFWATTLEDDGTTTNEAGIVTMIPNKLVVDCDRVEVRVPYQNALGKSSGSPGYGYFAHLTVDSSNVPFGL